MKKALFTCYYYEDISGVEGKVAEAEFDGEDAKMTSSAGPEAESVEAQGSIPAESQEKQLPDKAVEKEEEEEEHDGWIHVLGHDKLKKKVNIG